MDGDFDDEEISFTSSDTDSIIGQWENLDTQIPAEDSRQTNGNTSVQHHEPFNLLDPGLSRDDKTQEKIKKDHEDEKAGVESKNMPQNIENDKDGKESKDKTKPRGQSEHYLTILEGIRARKKNKEEQVKILSKEMGIPTRDAKYILDNPNHDPDLSRKIGIRFAEPVERDHEDAAELGIDPKEVAYMREKEYKNLQDLRKQKKMMEALERKQHMRHMEMLRRRGPSPVEDPRQAILDMDPRPPHLKDLSPNQVTQLPEYQNQVPDIVVDADGFPACMPPEIRQKRQEVGFFQADFNADWARMVLRSKIDPLKAILMKINPSQTSFPEINTGSYTSVQSVLEYVDNLDPAKCEILARNPSLIKDGRFIISREFKEKHFEKIIEAEDAEFGLHPNMTPELRQKRVEIAAFQMQFDRDWAKNVYKVRHHPLRVMLERLNPALHKANTLPGLPPLKIDDRMFFDHFPDVDRILDFVQNLDPTKVHILADNPHLYNNPNFSIYRDEREMNFEDREATRRSIGNQMLMEEAEARRMRQEASTPVPQQEPPKLPPNGELPPMTPRNGIPKGTLAPLTPMSGASSSRNSFTSPAPLGPIRERGPLAEPTQSEPRLGPMASSGKPITGPLAAAGGSHPLGSIKPRPGPLTPTSGIQAPAETGRPKPRSGSLTPASGSRPLAETGNAKPTRGPYGGGKPLGPIGGCKSTPETGNRKDPFGSPVPKRGNDKPSKSSLAAMGPLAPIGVLSKDMNSTTSTFGPLKHPLFD